VLVSRSADKLDALAAELASEHGIDTRVAAIDLAAPGAEADLFAASDGLEVGLFVYNAGADSLNTYFLDVPAEEWHGMLRRNCSVPLLASHRYGAEMVARKRGGILLVTSGAAWAGGGRLTTYGGTKAFDLVFGEGLWAELRRDGVDVLSLVVGATDTPALRASLEKFGVTVDDLSKMSDIADPADVAREGLTHLPEGPTWQVGVKDGAGPSLLGALPRRQAVELITQGHDTLFGD
jgi:short-subunit dehydrogenase